MPETNLMSAEIVDLSDQILTLRISGLLKHAEFVAAQKRAAEVIQKLGRVRLLVLLDHFAGTDKAGDWGDVSFQAQFDPFIEKIAVVGDKQWEDLVLLFTGKGLRRVPIEYFQSADLPKARTWLTT
jgi:hypothetical protein